MEERILRWVVDRLANRVTSSVEFTRGANLGTPSNILEHAALNIRVPFCRARCPFCAFPGDVYNEQYKKIYIDGLRDELRLYAEYFEISGKTPTVERVYLSGGTPTLLYKEFGMIRGYVNEHFPFNGKIALEASPSDLSDEVLRAIAESGITQVSIGVQTFNDTLLSRSLGRKGRRDELVSVLKKVMDYGFDYVNIDLMFAISNQTKDMLINDLETAAEIGVHGISTYPLMILPYTTLGKSCSTGGGSKPKKGIIFDSSYEARETELYLAIVDTMERASYKLRAIWSFSLKPEAYEGPYEHDCFIGLGPRAWGMTNNRFTLNSPSTEDYLATLNEGKLPIHATSEVRNSPVVKLARNLYHGKVDSTTLKDLEGEDFKLSGLVGLLRLVGLAGWEGDNLKLTKKALAYGSLATKKIAVATLTKMDEVLRAG